MGESRALRVSSIEFGGDVPKAWEKVEHQEQLGLNLEGICSPRRPPQAIKGPVVGNGVSGSSSRFDFPSRAREIRHSMPASPKRKCGANSKVVVKWVPGIVYSGIISNIS